MVPFRAGQDLLTSIPGSALTAAAVISEIRASVTEYFPDGPPGLPAGPCPGNHESAGKRHSGRRRHGSQHLQPVLVEAALGRRPPPGLPQGSLPPAHKEMGRLPHPAAQEESDHRASPRDARDHLACPGHRQTLRRARRRFLHPPHRPRQTDPPPDRKARSPRPHRQPPARRLTTRPHEPGSADAPPGLPRLSSCTRTWKKYPAT